MIERVAVVVRVIVKEIVRGSRSRSESNHKCLTHVNFAMQARSTESIFQWLPRVNVLIIGPGLGRDTTSFACVRAVVCHLVVRKTSTKEYQNIYQDKEMASQTETETGKGT